MPNFDETMQFSLSDQDKDKVTEVFSLVYEALSEKGYYPTNQIIGYLVSGDPTYVTSHKNARKTIQQIDRNDLLEKVLNFYFEKNGIKNKKIG